jgi:cytochrome c biogenesis protein CcdA
MGETSSARQIYPNIIIKTIGTNFMLNKTRIWKWIKEIFSFLSSLYAVALLLGIIASIIPQILPIFFNPLIVEGAKYVMIILICFLGSYFLFRNMVRKIEKSIIAPLSKKLTQ